MIVNASGHDESDSRFTLLWTNSSPTAEFKANTVAEFDRGNYKFLYVLCLVSTTNLQLDTSIIINDAELQNQVVMVRYGPTKGCRTSTFVNSGLSFSAAQYETGNTNGSVSAGTSTKHIIPYKIYGGV